MLKKEIRILGLSANTTPKGVTIVVGVVFRGKKWLDGIITCTLTPKERNQIARISEAIRKSKQFSQLHAVIISERQITPRKDLAIASIQRNLGLPVIRIVDQRKLQTRKATRLHANYYELFVHGKKLHAIAKGISRENTQGIFTLTSMSTSPTPEAVRVADLIAGQVLGLT